jgi:23S rRNA G2445 N2-methylase RlmL
MDVLFDELKELDLNPLSKNPSGVEFETNWEGCYKANLWLRTATRVIKPILDFPAYQLDDLYHNTLKHDFTKYITPDQTLAIDASVRESQIRDQRMVALKVKDAIVDQFREKFSVRPDVDSRKPALQVMVRVVKNQVSLAIDTSGVSLSQRGYRSEAGEAPLREHLAAGLLRMSGWEPGVPLIDPMCGSGTFLIEAALLAKRIAPGLLHKGFAFEKLQGFKSDVWERLVNEAMEAEVENPKGVFVGSDMDGKVLRAAKANADRAGVLDLIEFKRLSVTELKPPAEVDAAGLVMVNPPYGERLDSERLGRDGELEDLYKDLAFSLRSHFAGWKLWLLSGNPELTRGLRLKASRKFPVYNGNINCRFLGYEIENKPRTLGGKV